MIKTNTLLSNKYLHIVNLIMNGIIVSHKIFFFTSNPDLTKIYIVILCLILLILIISKEKKWKQFFKYIILFIHALFHGLFLLSFPMGMVFAMTGSYILTLKILLFFYLPSFLMLVLNIYILKYLKLKLS